MPPNPAAAPHTPPLTGVDRAEFVLVAVLGAVAGGALALGAPAAVVVAAAVGGLGLGLGAASWTGSAWGGALGAVLWTLSALDTPEALIVPGMALPWLLTLTPVALRRPDGLAPFALALCGLLLMIAPPMAAEALAGACGILGAAALSGAGAAAARVALRALGAALCLGALWLVLLPNPRPPSRRPQRLGPGLWAPLGWRARETPPARPRSSACSSPPWSLRSGTPLHRSS
ncbi:MAG: hypothetical protein IPI35_22970 [Deltaproteobacteria bacterium]|nr:hypothetical protein [Deltaproteobacteria bacterium]